MSALVWKQPPLRVNAVFNDEVCDQLRAHPGQWALVRTYRHHGRCNNDFDYRPLEVEIQVRHINAHKPGGRCELYARWLSLPALLPAAFEDVREDGDRDGDEGPDDQVRGAVPGDVG